MDIIFLARHLDLVNGGGSSRSLHAIAKGLAEREINVTILVTDNYDVSEQVAYDVLDRTQRFRNVSYPTLFYKLKKEIRSIAGKYDIIHVFNPAYLGPMGNIRDSLGVPMVGRLNTYTPFCSSLDKMNGKCHRKCNAYLRLIHDERGLIGKVSRIPRYISQSYIEPKMRRHCDQFFAISPAVKNVYVEFGMDAKDISVVPNFLPGEPRIEDTTTNDIPSKFLYVGRLSKLKGVRYLLEALHEFPGEGLHLDIVGDGPEIDSLMKSTQTVDANVNIEFHGWVEHENLATYYANSDVFIHPHTWPEPFGRVILEALQYRLPVLCSNIGAPPWISGDAGLTFKRADPDSIEETLNKIVSDPQLFQSLQRNCESRTNRFDRDRIMNKIISEYESLLS